MLKVYLAGGMRSGWQDIVKERCGVCEYYDPRTHGLTNPTEYTKWDLDHIAKCDVLFAYMEKDNPSGFGLCIELGYAKALGKTIIFVNESDNRHLAMANCVADIFYTTLEDGMDVLMITGEVVSRQIDGENIC
jgi:nucleoside 2-deoxyribosyltransferase